MSSENPIYPVVTGQQIYFATLRHEHLPLYVRWFSDLGMTANLGAIGFAATLEDEESWYQQASRQNAERITFAIHIKETDQPIGNISLFEINHRRQSAALGILIGEASQRSKGYGTEAVRLMAEYGFFFLNLYNIKLWYYGYNARAGRAYERAGFREAGRVRGAIPLGNQRYDEILMDIVRDDVDLRAMSMLVPGANHD